VLADPRPHEHGLASAFHRLVARLDPAGHLQVPPGSGVDLANAGPVQLTLF
jgi:hypothetical protein